MTKFTLASDLILPPRTIGPTFVKKMYFQRLNHLFLQHWFPDFSWIAWRGVDIDCQPCLNCFGSWFRCIMRLSRPKRPKPKGSTEKKNVISDIFARRFWRIRRNDPLQQPHHQNWVSQPQSRNSSLCREPAGVWKKCQGTAKRSKIHPPSVEALDYVVKNVGRETFAKVLKIIKARDGKALAAKMFNPPPNRNKRRRCGGLSYIFPCLFRRHLEWKRVWIFPVAQI